MISVTSCTRESRPPFPAAEQLQIIDHEDIEAALAFEPPRPRRQLGDRKPAALVDIEGERLDFPGGLGDPMKFRLADVASADLGGRNARLFGDDAGRQLLGRHFELEKADDAAIHGFPGAVGFGLVLVRTSDVEGDVGRQRRLAHAGTPGDNHKIGRLQAAHVAIEIGEARRHLDKRPSRS